MRFEPQFLSSFATIATLPTGDVAEIALIGRSNVGKSSLINALTNRKQLAKTSSTPGKTQLLNYFRITTSESSPAGRGEFYLVDMPGYGFAKAARDKRIEWAKVAERYFLEREQLRATGILIDARHPLLESDLMVLNWFRENGLRFFAILTKLDKTKQQEAAKHIKVLKNELPEGISIFATSSETARGIAELRKFMVERAFSPQP